MVFPTIRNEESRIFLNSDSGGRGFESRQPYHKGTLIMIRSGSLCFAPRPLPKRLTSRGISTSRKLYTEKSILGRVILPRFFDD